MIDVIFYCMKMFSSKLADFHFFTMCSNCTYDVDIDGVITEFTYLLPRRTQGMLPVKQGTINNEGHESAQHSNTLHKMQKYMKHIPGFGTGVSAVQREVNANQRINVNNLGRALSTK